jgi:hypothetical protein
MLPAGRPQSCPSVVVTTTDYFSRPSSEVERPLNEWGGTQSLLLGVKEDPVVIITARLRTDWSNHRTFDCDVRGDVEGVMPRDT